MTTYHVTLEQFEGPLDLLLSLIEAQELDVTQVSLAQVADQYLAYMQEHEEEISLEHMASFLSVAAKLILIKSKALLPLLELDADEEAEIHDLAWQLAQYKKFKKAATDLDGLFAQARPAAAREAFLGVSLAKTLPEGITPEDLKASFERALGSIPLIEKLEERIVSDVVSLQKRIVQVQELVHQRATVTFSEMTKTAQDKMDVVVSFLAVLELVRQKLVDIEQDRMFAEITVRRQEKDAAVEEGHVAMKE